MSRYVAFVIYFLSVLCVESASAETYAVYPDDGPISIQNPKTDDVIAVSIAGAHSFCCTYKMKDSLTIVDGVYTATGGFISAKNSAGSAIEFAKDEGFRNPLVSFSEENNVTSRACMRSKNEEANGGDVVYLTLSIPETPPAEVRVECKDTTLIGAYNTFASDFLYLELIAAQGRRGHIVSIEGLDSNDNQVFSVSLNVVARSDVAIHTLVGKNTIGRVVVTHDGPAASLNAYMAEYRQDSASSSGLVLVDRQALSRGN